MTDAEAAPGNAGQPLPSLDVDLVRRLVAEQLPQWAHLPVTPVPHGGWDNRTFRLGAELTVRLPSAEGYVQQVAKEQRWLPVLAPQLPLPVPQPVAAGAPGQGYPYPWSVYGWIEGDIASADRIADPAELAVALAGFLVALRHVDSAGGPAPGAHNFHRGGRLAVYDQETQEALAVLGTAVDAERALAVWEEALSSTWTAEPVWFHGDVAAGNLLVRDGRLAAVIDFGTCGVGDPACDLVIAWTLLPEPARPVFAAAIGLDGATWARARGWALWKALITLAGAEPGPRVVEASRTLDRVLADL